MQVLLNKRFLSLAVLALFSPPLPAPTLIYKSTEYFFDDIEAQAKFKQLILERWEFCVLSVGMTVTQKDTLRRYKSPLSQ